MQAASTIAITAPEMKHRLASNSRKLENMITQFPQAVPEIPVSNVEKAAEYYASCPAWSGTDFSGKNKLSHPSGRSFEVMNRPADIHFRFLSCPSDLRKVG